MIFQFYRQVLPNKSSLNGYLLVNHRIYKQALVDHKIILIRTELVKEKMHKLKDLKAQLFKPHKLKITHLLYMRKSYTSLEDMMARRTIAICEYSIQSKTAG